MIGISDSYGGLELKYVESKPGEDIVEPPRTPVILTPPSKVKVP